MKAFALTDRNFAVSYRNKPFASIPAEQKLLFQEIQGKVIVYDIHFLSELPGKQPVKGATNYIFTDGSHEKVKGAFCFETLEELKSALSKEKDENILIIHGASLYECFYDQINIFHITKIDYAYKADAYLKNLDDDPDFEITRDSDELYCFDIIYQFLQYERKRRIN